ncbi:MAG TPA: superoxide dismutase [Bacteroidales bacterium]|nr:superoxide dismutase [Bacteroidales bacterium]
MPFKLPELLYAPDALMPVISKQTIEFHYGKHHQAYVNNLNNLVTGTPFENASLETIIKEAEGGIFNNGAQVWNHTFYFESFSPSGPREPIGHLASAIDATFGSFASFKEQFAKSAATLFGSGWAWLVKDKDGKLRIVQESNAGNPLRNGMTPILTCDVWEHAYYLDYQNRRPDYVQSFWNILNWEAIGKRF